VLLLATACFIVFGDLALIPVRIHALALAVLPFVTWAAIRFGVSGSALAILLVATIATVETALGYGPFASNSPFVNAALLDVFFAVLSVSGLTLASAIAEREQSEREREQLVRKQAALQAHLEDQKMLMEYEKAVESAEEMIAVVDRNYRYLIANRKFLAMRGMTKEQVLGRSAADVLSKGAFEAVIKEKLDECFRGKVVRYEMKYSYPELGEREILVSYFPSEGPDGIDRAACILHDITERKKAEEALARMSRRLIEAQEQERTRIARELHDNINQRLALLAVEVEASKQHQPRSLEDMSQLLSNIHEQVTAVSSEVQSISHELHSSHLEYLGVVAALKNFCREFGQRQQLTIAFTQEVVPQSVSHEASLCLFRILQEALHNAVKHSNVRHFDVKLGCSGDQLELTVSDRGTGFDAEAVINKGGLGLISMRERVRLVNGTIEIESKPIGGTVIHVSVPFEPEHVSERAVGE